MFYRFFFTCHWRWIDYLLYTWHQYDHPLNVFIPCVCFLHSLAHWLAAFVRCYVNDDWKKLRDGPKSYGWIWTIVLGRRSSALANETPFITFDWVQYFVAHSTDLFPSPVLPLECTTFLVAGSHQPGVDIKLVCKSPGLIVWVLLAELVRNVAKPEQLNEERERTGFESTHSRQVIQDMRDKAEIKPSTV